MPAHFLQSLLVKKKEILNQEIPKEARPALAHPGELVATLRENATPAVHTERRTRNPAATKARLLPGHMETREVRNREPDRTGNPKAPRSVQAPPPAHARNQKRNPAHAALMAEDRKRKGRAKKVASRPTDANPARHPMKAVRNLHSNRASDHVDMTIPESHAALRSANHTRKHTSPGRKDLLPRPGERKLQKRLPLPRATRCV